MPHALFSSRKIKNHSSSASKSLRRAAGLGLGLLTLLSLSAGQSAFAGNVTWNGPSGADWFANPTYWSNGGYPMATDDAQNNTGNAMTLGQNTTINSFFSTGAFTLQGGTFSGNQANAGSTIQVNNVFTDNGGQINNFTVNQGSGGSLVFTGSGGNSLSGDIINSSMDLSTNMNAFVNFVGTNTVNGAISLGTTSNGIELNDGNANLVLGSKGSLTGFGTVSQGNSNATLTNNGTVNATGGTLAVTNNYFTNTGTAEATGGGLLALSGVTTTTNTGLLSATNGGVLDISGTLNSNAGNSINSVGGTVNVLGANLYGTINETSGSTLVLDNSGKNFYSTTVNGNLDLATNKNAFVNFIGTNTVNGQISLGTTSNGIELNDGNANLVLGTGGSLVGFGVVTQGNSNATLTNNGLINATGGTLAVTNNYFTNNGTAEATKGGTLSLSSATTTTNSAGSTLAANGAGSVVSIAGAFIGVGSNLITSANGGQVQVNGAALSGTFNTSPSTALIFNNSGNTLTTATVNGNLDLATNKNAFVNFIGTNTVNGQISLGTTSNGIELNDGNANLVLGTGGSLVGFGSVTQGNSNATLTNNGLINATGGTLALTNNFANNFTNSGTAEATGGGTLSLSNATTTTNTGLLSATNGGVLDISGTLNSNAGNSINSVGGTVNVLGANLYGTINETSGSTLVLDNSGKNFYSTTVNGNLDLATNSNAFVNFVGVNTVNGQISLGTTSNGIELNDGNANLVLGTGGSLVGFGSVTQGNSNATLTNNGTLNANVSGQTLALTNNFANSFVNNGTAEATNGGTLSLSNATTTTNTGLLAATNGGVLDISGTLNSNAGNSINSVGGTVNVLGANLYGTINETSGSTLVLDNSGKTFHNTTINGNLDMATNAAAFVNFDGVNTVNGQISLGTTSNGIQLQDGNANLILGSSGSLVGFGSVTQGNSNATLTNNGTLNANVSGQTLALTNNFANNFTNSGTAEATNGGTLSLSSATTTTNSAGSTLAANGAGSVVSIAGAFIGVGSNLITSANGGQVQVNGAALSGTFNTSPSTALIFNNSGNTLTTATVNGNLDLATNKNAFVNFIGTNTVNGQISLGTTSNGIELNDGNANLVLGTGGSLVGFGSVTQGNSNATLTNNGTVNATGGTLAVTNDYFTNTGTAEVQNGATLSVAGNTTTTDSGNILVAKGGTATFGNPNLTQTAGLTQVNGTLNSPLTLSGGTLSGSGTVNGNVANNGGTVAAGSPFGTLAVNGAFTQASGGILDAVFSSTQSSLLAVNGAVTTGGMLDVNYLGTGAYTSGSAPFTFLDYTTLATSLSGTGSTQYFSNETFDAMGNGVITGQNGFVYDLINNTGLNALQLEVVTNGAPVPEASTNISLGVLLALGGAGLWRVKRRTVSAAD